jgi:bifunctional non-homologous end joining protein LigD
MLASLETASLVDPNLVYEPKYDGIRAIAEITPEHVRLWSRLGNEKTRQFPEIAEALTKWAQRHKARVVVDGEIVALDSNGHPAGFQQLQGRINLSDGRSQAPGGAAYIVFDILFLDSLGPQAPHHAEKRVLGTPPHPQLASSEIQHLAPFHDLSRASALALRARPRAPADPFTGPL